MLTAHQVDTHRRTANSLPLTLSRMNNPRTQPTTIPTSLPLITYSPTPSIPPPEKQAPTRIPHSTQRPSPTTTTTTTTLYLLPSRHSPLSTPNPSSSFPSSTVTPLAKTTSTHPSYPFIPLSRVRPLQRYPLPHHHVQSIRQSKAFRVHQQGYRTLHSLFFG